MSVLRHWLAYRERWQDAPRVITPRDDDDVAEWRRLGYRVEGPFVLEADAGAVSQDVIRSALDEAATHPGIGDVAAAILFLRGRLNSPGGQ